MATWHSARLSSDRDGSRNRPRSSPAPARHDALPPSSWPTPFFTTKREGRGLGLTIVQEILTNHHLPFSLQNRAGGGAEFRIDF